MKKIVLFSLIACLGFVGSGFAGNCEPTVAKADKEGVDFISFSNGNNGFACNRLDYKTKRSCDPGEVVSVSGKHRVGGKVFDGDKFYRCEKGARDKWVLVDVAPVCNDSLSKNFVGVTTEGVSWYANYTGVKDGVTYYSGGLCYKEPEQQSGSEEAEKSSKGSTSQKTKVSTSWAGELNPCEGGVCAVYARGGDVEQKGCLKNPSATNFVDKWKSEGSSCDATNARTARCFKQKNVAGADVMSCAAKICNDDSALWLYRKSENNYQSYGLCRKQDWLQKEFCDKNHKSCGNCGGKCMLNVFEWTNGSFGKTNAFYDDKLCVCVSDENGQPNDNEKPNGDEPVVETTPDCDDPCEVRQNISVICPDGRSGLNTDKLLYKICPDDLKKLGLKSSNCPEVQKSFDACHDADCIKNLINDVNLYKELIKAVCETGTGSASGSTGNSSAGGTSASEVLAAQKTLDDFYAYAKGNRSVWKDAEGKFNTTRLASDLTAGVVLGTVGGVVSGVVIKKKQVEKGFDALHCVIGGQPVADWGDTFNVGLR